MSHSDEDQQLLFLGLYKIVPVSQNDGWPPSWKKNEKFQYLSNPLTDFDDPYTCGMFLRYDVPLEGYVDTVPHLRD